MVPLSWSCNTQAEQMPAFNSVLVQSCITAASDEILKADLSQLSNTSSWTDETPRRRKSEAAMDSKALEMEGRRCLFGLWTMMNKRSTSLSCESIYT